MKIIFSTTHFGFLRNFQSTLRLLAERGHRVHLVGRPRDALDSQTMVDALVREFPGVITSELVPFTRHRLWYALGTALRASLDYWRYLNPRYAAAVRLRARAAEQAPAAAVALARVPVLGSWPMLRALSAGVRRLERVLPPPPEIAEILRRERTDLLLMTPLLYFHSHQVDHLRAAQYAGIKSVLCVGSWDHLTTKGLIHEVPDRVLVWNAAQREEAIELHGIPADRVIVTGAQAYDHWFTATPTVSQEVFCRDVGLSSDQPIVLYLCSSPFIAPYEVGFVRRWIEVIRASSDPRLHRAGLLVRPHPQNAAQWQDVDLAAQYANVALWPKTGVNPIGGSARADYYHSMYFSRAVVGVNTSAQIEAGIVGRPVYSVTAEEFTATQEGTLHFQHLKTVEGGLLHLATTLEEHVAQLSTLMSGGAEPDDRAQKFVQAFVRPHGLDVAATPRLVDELERFASQPSAAPRTATIRERALRKLLVPAAVLATALTLEREKFKAMVLHWTRPARLVARRFVSRSIYTARFVRRLPRYALCVAETVARLMCVRPARWMVHRAKMGVHTVLVWRKGEPDQVP